MASLFCFVRISLSLSDNLIRFDSTSSSQLCVVVRFCFVMWGSLSLSLFFFDCFLFLLSLLLRWHCNDNDACDASYDGMRWSSWFYFCELSDFWSLHYFVARKNFLKNVLRFQSCVMQTRGTIDALIFGRIHCSTTVINFALPPTSQSLIFICY